MSICLHGTRPNPYQNLARASSPRVRVRARARVTAVARFQDEGSRPKPKPNPDPKPPTRTPRGLSYAPRELEDALPHLVHEARVQVQVVRAVREGERAHARTLRLRNALHLDAVGEGRRGVLLAPDELHRHAAGAELLELAAEAAKWEVLVRRANAGEILRVLRKKALEHGHELAVELRVGAEGLPHELAESLVAKRRVRKLPMTGRSATRAVNGFVTGRPAAPMSTMPLTLSAERRSRQADRTARRVPDPDEGFALELQAPHEVFHLADVDIGAEGEVVREAVGRKLVTASGPAAVVEVVAQHLEARIHRGMRDEVEGGARRAEAVTENQQRRVRRPGERVVREPKAPRDKSAGGGPRARTAPGVAFAAAGGKSASSRAAARMA
eukprot:CAMPEP_0118886646 /NCGR_PEP_ID=MMETSP1163-20130328/24645_1 /TAXON_ID=124430 /ORGANISM="Phaeomonas parva, Strain CCMP2877" /LENGTH=384 /DNA_ID=CAMNT_0006824915 /DNA_START=747 /DNA_END=1905 /DNA_ORIENTATION=+